MEKPEPDPMIKVGGAYHVMKSIDGWERSFGRPIVSTDQVAIWAAVQPVGGTEKIEGYGRLLATMPKGWAPE